MPIQIFLGTGGVGKTSVAAATALKAARAGSKCLVLTIDPAMRLRTALGMDASGMEQKVPLDLPGEKGELWAAILDVRASLDRAVLREAKPEEAVIILEHPLYKVLATSLAGMQELMAIERIHQALGDGFESIFIDTAPSRHALEFLDKPEFFAHLVSFPIVKLVGRTYQWWIHSRIARLGKMSFELYSKVEDILGATLVHQVLDFFSIFRKIAEGYADRAKQTLSLLHDPQTTSFTIVTTPFKAKRDGEYFCNELRKRNFPVGSMVVNRVWPDLRASLPAGSPPQLRDLLVWYKSVSSSQQEAWEEICEKFSASIPKLIALQELSRDVDGLSALDEMAQKMES
jgi:anion-transporting  ArsA/GET3 family ATPase